MYQKCTNPGGSATMSRKHGPKHSKHLLSRRHAVACSYGAVTVQLRAVSISFHYPFFPTLFLQLCVRFVTVRFLLEKRRRRHPLLLSRRHQGARCINADPLHNGQSMRKHPTLLVLCVRVPQLTEWPRGLLKARLHL